MNWDCCDSDFEFRADDNKVCRVRSVLAEFLSPKIARLRNCDASFNSYTFKNTELFNVFENLVSSLRSGRSFRVERSNFVPLLRLSDELENNELRSSLISRTNTERLNLQDAVLILQAGADLGTAFSDRLGDLREFVASHFHELEKDILDDLDLETSQLLLSSPSLKVTDEDSLYDFVHSRASKDLKFASLFEFVYFEYLSVDRIKNFESFARENLLDRLNSSIWTRICSRLVIGTKTEKNPRTVCEMDCDSDEWQHRRTGFVYNPSNPLGGIMAHLAWMAGGNVHDKGIVKVTATRVRAGYEPKSVVDHTPGSEYLSSNEMNAWICFDFKERRVIPKSYVLRSSGYDRGQCHLRSWVIEVSNTGMSDSWTEIDRRTNNDDMNAKFATQNFQISRIPSRGFRFIRLRQIGLNHRGDYFIALTRVEFFGDLYEP